MKEPLLKQGPREAPEPETAEERSKRMGMKTAGGGVAVGGIGLAKTGLLGKIFLWWFVWHGTLGVWRVFGFAGLAVVVAAIAAYFVLRARRESQ
jgi:hypothetical protein